MKRLLRLAAFTGIVALAYKLGQGNGVNEAIVRLTSLDPEAGAKLRSVMSTVVVPPDEMEAAQWRRRTNP